MISLIMLTYRPGGIDLFASSFTDVKGDYEVIVVDDYPGRVGRGEAEKLLRSKNVPLTYYGGSKHKAYPDTKGGLVNAMNTGLLHAKGDYIVFVSDYTMLPPYWLQQWEKVRTFYGRDTLVSGTAIMYASPKPNLVDDVRTWDGPSNLVPKWPWVPKEFETFYYGVESYFYSRIGGMDERADHCHCWQVSSVMAQAKKLGYRLEVQSELVCHMIDHRVWDNPEERWGFDGLWKIGHLQSETAEPDWQVPSPNPYNFVEERRKVQGIQARDELGVSYAEFSTEEDPPPYREPYIRELMSYDAQCPASCELHPARLRGTFERRIECSPLHWSRQIEWPWALHHAELDREHRCLDVGSGWSVLKYAVAKRCERVDCLEVDQGFIDKASKSIEILDRFKNIYQFQGDVRELPFTSNAYDRVFCLSVLEHVKDGHVKAVKECLRVLKPGGTLLLTMDVRIEGECDNNFYVDTPTLQQMGREIGFPMPSGSGTFLGAKMGPEKVAVVVFLLKLVKERT